MDPAIESESNRTPPQSNPTPSERTTTDPAAPERRLQTLWTEAKSRWLKRLLKRTEAFNLFNAIDNELFQTLGADRVSVLIASAEPHEGRTSIAALLAALSAAYYADRKVLFVDAHLGAGHPPIFGSSDARASLQAYFTGAASVEELTVKTPLPNFDHVQSGAADRPRAKFSPQRFAEFMREAQTRYDEIFVDSPPAGASKDVVSLAKIVKNVLVVVRYGGPNREQVQAMLGEFRRVGAAPLGVILNQRIFPIPRLFYGIR